ncbi:conserved protein, unknown function [Hepatocystis sp. ex Piliocolobus tephrosceles]|nr:conserved protein, unknown function [Hepatocystis sp. ex Piliocolobus tephrosceles]
MNRIYTFETNLNDIFTGHNIKKSEKSCEHCLKRKRVCKCETIKRELGCEEEGIIEELWEVKKYYEDICEKIVDKYKDVISRFEYDKDIVEYIKNKKLNDEIECEDWLYFYELLKERKILERCVDIKKTNELLILNTFHFNEEANFISCLNYYIKTNNYSNIHHSWMGMSLNSFNEYLDYNNICSNNINNNTHTFETEKVSVQNLNIKQQKIDNLYIYKNIDKNNNISTQVPPLLLLLYNYKKIYPLYYYLYIIENDKWVSGINNTGNVLDYGSVNYIWNKVVRGDSNKIKLFHLITSNCVINNDDINFNTFLNKEKKKYRIQDMQLCELEKMLCISHLICSLGMLNIGGCFIMKIKLSFSNTLMSLFAILSICFKKLEVYKPSCCYLKNIVFVVATHFIGITSIFLATLNSRLQLAQKELTNLLYHQSCSTIALNIETNIKNVNSTDNDINTISTTRSNNCTNHNLIPKKWLTDKFFEEYTTCIKLFNECLINNLKQCINVSNINLIKKNIKNTKDTFISKFFEKNKIMDIPKKDKLLYKTYNDIYYNGDNIISNNINIMSDWLVTNSVEATYESESENKNEKMSNMMIYSENKLFVSNDDDKNSSNSSSSNNGNSILDCKNKYVDNNYDSEYYYDDYYDSYYDDCYDDNCYDHSYDDYYDDSFDKYHGHNISGYRSKNTKQISEKSKERIKLNKKKMLKIKKALLCYNINNNVFFFTNLYNINISNDVNSVRNRNILAYEKHITDLLNKIHFKNSDNNKQKQNEFFKLESEMIKKRSYYVIPNKKHNYYKTEFEMLLKKQIYFTNKNWFKNYKRNDIKYYKNSFYLNQQLFIDLLHCRYYIYYNKCDIYINSLKQVIKQYEPINCSYIPYNLYANIIDILIVLKNCAGLDIFEDSSFLKNFIFISKEKTLYDFFSNYQPGYYVSLGSYPEGEAEPSDSDDQNIIHVYVKNMMNKKSSYKYFSELLMPKLKKKNICELICIDLNALFPNYINIVEKEIKIKNYFVVSLIIAFNNLKKNGNMIIRLSTMLTYFTAGLIYILFNSFEKIQFFLPPSCDDINLDFYIYCYNFNENYIYRHYVQYIWDTIICNQYVGDQFGTNTGSNVGTTTNMYKSDIYYSVPLYFIMNKHYVLLLKKFNTYYFKQHIKICLLFIKENNYFTHNRSIIKSLLTYFFKAYVIHNKSYARIYKSLKFDYNIFGNNVLGTSMGVSTGADSDEDEDLYENTDDITDEKEESEIDELVEDTKKTKYSSNSSNVVNYKHLKNKGFDQEQSINEITHKKKKRKKKKNYDDKEDSDDESSEDDDEGMVITNNKFSSSCSESNYSIIYEYKNVPSEVSISDSAWSSS